MRARHTYLDTSHESQWLNWEEALADGSFAPAKNGAVGLGRPRKGRIQSGRWWSMVKEFRFGVDGTSPSDDVGNPIAFMTEGRLSIVPEPASIVTLTIGGLRLGLAAIRRKTWLPPFEILRSYAVVTLRPRTAVQAEMLQWGL